MAPESYSAFIRTVRILLPVTALMLLATLFLLARAPTGETTIPYAEVEAIAREQRLSTPTFSGVTTDGTRVTAGAGSLRPEDGGFVAEDLSARMQTTDGATVSVSAGTGTLDPERSTVRMTGLTRIQTSTGYRMETGALSADLTAGTLDTDGALEIQAPFGKLIAGRLSVTDGNDAQGQSLVFHDGVHLLYQPRD